MDCRNNIFTYVVLEIKPENLQVLWELFLVQHTPVGAKIEVKMNTFIKNFKGKIVH